MDVEIDTDAVLGGIADISNHIAMLKSVASYMNSRVERAGDEFTSINYDRAQNAAQEMSEKLNRMLTNLEEVQAYLNRIVGLIEAYFKNKF